MMMRMRLLLLLQASQARMIDADRQTKSAAAVDLGVEYHLDDDKPASAHNYEAQADHWSNKDWKVWKKSSSTFSSSSSKSPEAKQLLQQQQQQQPEEVWRRKKEEEI